MDKKNYLSFMDGESRKRYARFIGNWTKNKAISEILRFSAGCRCFDFIRADEKAKAMLKREGAKIYPVNFTFQEAKNGV